MVAADDTLYAKLLGETARIQWAELQPFFARGALMWVRCDEDLIAIATAIAENRSADVEAWLRSGALQKMDDAVALRLSENQGELWAVVVAPWVLVQDRQPAH
jgi:hypothetical protein